MGAILQRVRTEALSLSPEERATLARDLVSSLDAPCDEGVTAAWDDEVCERLDALETGNAELVSRTEFARRLRSKTGQG